MIICNIFSAQPIGKEKIPEAQIIIKDQFPSFKSGEVSLEEMGEKYKKEGKKLADILFDHLPGGTMDALLIEILDRKKSLLIVPFDKIFKEEQ